MGQSFKIIVYGNPITKKNGSRIVRCGKFTKLIPSKYYCEYEKSFVIQARKDLKIDYPINLKCVYYMQTKRRVDLTNLLSATNDCLVACGVLSDDNCQIVQSLDGSRVLYDKECPRVEIEITEI